MVLKKIRIAQRFPDLETAFGFAEENKIVYDEVIVLFDHMQDVPEQEEKEETQELPEQNVDKDKLIQDLLKENSELKGDIPKPPKPVKKGFLGKKAPSEKTEIRATK